MICPKCKNEMDKTLSKKPNKLYPNVERTLYVCMPCGFITAVKHNCTVYNFGKLGNYNRITVYPGDKKSRVQFMADGKYFEQFHDKKYTAEEAYNKLSIYTLFS